MYNVHVDDLRLNDIKIEEKKIVEKFASQIEESRGILVRHEKEKLFFFV